ATRRRGRDRTGETSGRTHDDRAGVVRGCGTARLHAPEPGPAGGGSAVGNDSRRPRSLERLKGGPAKTSATLPHLLTLPVNAVHCAGIGGMGGGPLAIYLARRGFRVSGEDDAMSPPMRAHLERAGVVLTKTGDTPAGCDLVVCSSAIKPGHPVV